MNLARRIVSSVFCALLLTSIAGAAAFQDDLHGRRERLVQLLSPDSMLILWSAPERVYSGDVNYPYRQDSNFFYLTGIEQPESILVILPGNTRTKEFLFIRPRDSVREHWEGHSLSSEEAAQRSGIGSVYGLNDFEPFIEAVFSDKPFQLGNLQAYLEHDTFSMALKNGNAQIAVVGPPPGNSDAVPDSYAYAKKLRERYSGLQMRDVTALFGKLRLTKTEYEQKMLAESARISAEAHREGMKVARPDVWEYQVQAAMEYIFKKDGAIGWGYPSIVASGPNATTLHYEASTRQMKDGDLLLVDAAANYDYLTTDITRTYPINGKFTQAQKDIYEIVLRAQDEGIKVAVKGATLGEINAKTVEVIKDGLLKLGLITDTKGQQYSIWYTHSSSHWIGIDVHDVGERNARLADGMAFTIEPGIYIRQEALDNLAKTPENQAFIQRVQPAVNKYKNIGVRIEDSFVMNDGRARSISVGIPRTVDEIEAFMKAR
jgi:Xaa-Pro aminopeptidase